MTTEQIDIVRYLKELEKVFTMAEVDRVVNLCRDDTDNEAAVMKAINIVFRKVG